MESIGKKSLPDLDVSFGEIILGAMSGKLSRESRWKTLL